MQTRLVYKGMDMDMGIDSLVLKTNFILIRPSSILSFSLRCSVSIKGQKKKKKEPDRMDAHSAAIALT